MKKKPEYSKSNKLISIGPVKTRRHKMAHKKKKEPTNNGRFLAASLIIGTEDKDNGWSYNNETRLGVLLRILLKLDEIGRIPDLLVCPGGYFIADENNTVDSGQ